MTGDQAMAILLGVFLGLVWPYVANARDAARRRKIDEDIRQYRDTPCTEARIRAAAWASNANPNRPGYEKELIVLAKDVMRQCYGQEWTGPPDFKPDGVGDGAGAAGQMSPVRGSGSGGAGLSSPGSSNEVVQHYVGGTEPIPRVRPPRNG